MADPSETRISHTGFGRHLAIEKLSPVGRVCQ
jgi:hypothetical protein